MYFVTCNTYDNICVLFLNLYGKFNFLTNFHKTYTSLKLLTYRIKKQPI